MSNRLRKGLTTVAALFVTLAGAYSDKSIGAVIQIYEFAKANPVRAIFILAGLAIIVFTFREDILDLFGIQTNKRLFEKVKGWLLDTFKYAVVGTHLDKNTFNVDVEFLGRRYSVVRSPTKPLLFILARLTTDVSTSLSLSTAPSSLMELRDNIMVELLRSQVNMIDVSVENGIILQASFQVPVHLSREFDEYRLVEAIAVATKLATMFDVMVAKSLRQLPPPPPSPSTSPTPQDHS